MKQKDCKEPYLLKENPSSSPKEAGELLRLSRLSSCPLPVQATGESNWGLVSQGPELWEIKREGISSALVIMTKVRCVGNRGLHGLAAPSWTLFWVTWVLAGQKTSRDASGGQDRALKPPCETPATQKEQRWRWHCTRCWSGSSPIACTEYSAPCSMCSLPPQSSGRGSGGPRELWSSFSCESFESLCWRAQREWPRTPPPMLFQRRYPAMCCWWMMSAQEWICNGRCFCNYRIIWCTCLSIMPTNISQKGRSPNALATCDLQLFKKKILLRNSDLINCWFTQAGSDLIKV